MQSSRASTNCPSISSSDLLDEQQINLLHLNIKVHNRAFHFEIADLITQFIAAFDDVVIGRFNKTRDEKAQVKVRYVYAPKERVLFDIVNKAQNLTLPVIAISLTDVTRDESRVFNKIYGFDTPGYRGDADEFRHTTHIGMPVPVNIGVSMSIIAAYQSDLDQILSNFIPYSNPYIILSWKIPEDFKLMTVQEIRSEVLWGGTMSLKYPVDSTAADKFRIEADTTFTIKGWLFPEAPKEPVKNIFFIDSNFYASTMMSNDRFAGYETYYTLSGGTYNHHLSTYTLTESETIVVSAAPTITNLMFAAHGEYHYIDDNLSLTSDNLTGDLLIVGKRFQYTQTILLSGTDLSLYPSITCLEYAHYPTVSGYVIDPSNYIIVNENFINLKLPEITAPGKLDVIIADGAGWDSFRQQNLSVNYMEQW